jgi:hypothetical protein
MFTLLFYVVKYLGFGARGYLGLLRDHTCGDLPTMRIQPQKKWLLETESEVVYN